MPKQDGRTRIAHGMGMTLSLPFLFSMHLTGAIVSVALVLPQACVSFSPQKNTPSDRRRISPMLKATPPPVGSTSSEPAATSGAPTPTTTSATAVFPVLCRISGADWLGDCRYVGEDLRPADLTLTGGLRFDLDAASAACTFSSFLTFPNGQSRRVEMAGFRAAGDPTMRLDAVEEGPIHMTVAELLPDTVLVNEVETMSGKLVMTTSLSLVDEGEELVMVSHEVGSGTAKVDGHQIWRLRRAKSKDDGGIKGGDDVPFRGTAGR